MKAAYSSSDEYASTVTLREAPAPPEGRGHGTITRDGCPVEIYAAIPAQGEAEIVHAAIPASGSVLELGCGTGRIADPLAELGHRVVGVDGSAEMLTYLRAADGVRATIEGLRLAETFSAVLLASNLVNTYDPAQRAAFLQTARRHLAPNGVLVLERHPPSYVFAAAVWTAGDIGLEVRDVVDHGDAVFSATLVHRLGKRVVEQDFSTRVLDDQTLEKVLRLSGFSGVKVLTPDARWVAASLG